MKESPFIRACGNWPNWAILLLFATIALVLSIIAAALGWPWGHLVLAGAAIFSWWAVLP